MNYWGFTPIGNIYNNFQNVFSIFCPVNITIVDQYNRKLNETVNEIPGSSYKKIGEGKQFYVPSNLEYDIIIKGYDIGNFTFRHLISTTETSALMKLFSDVPINENSLGYLNIIPGVNEYNLLMDYDGDGIIDEALIPEVSTTVEADVEPPVTIKTVGIQKHGSNDEWVTSNTEFNLTATDDLSGVKKIYYREWYSNSWIPWAEYNDNFLLTGEGLHYIEYYSIDYAGNVEEVHNQTHYLDDSSPVIDVIVPFVDEALQDGVTFEAIVTDLVGVDWVNFSIREPGGEYGTIIDPMYESFSAMHIGDDIWQLSFDTTLLPDGYYLLLVEASDMLGNQGNETVDFSIRNWAVIELLPNTKNHKAGRTVPIKFSLRIAEAVDPEQPFVRNEELNIVIYDEDDPETILQNSTYGEGSKNYRINSTSEHYITNFKTSKTPTAYVVEIWRKDMLLDSFEFETVK